jgi:CRISPR-associated exonuclease Cas4
MGPVTNEGRPGSDEPPDPIPLSALQHWAYCPRQCGLIHLDQVFDDNVHTLRGQAVHAQVDQPGFELRKGVRIERALPVWNDAIGLIGKTDAVEFDPATGAPYPVEYKHGSRNKAADIAHADDIQLAAQSLCLAEMTGHAVTEGALYYASSKRRRVVPITPVLQAEVVEIAAAFRAMLASGTLPAPTTDTRRCRACSLNERCQPEAWRRLHALGNLRARLFDPDAE